MEKNGFRYVVSVLSGIQAAVVGSHGNATVTVTYTAGADPTAAAAAAAAADVAVVCVAGKLWFDQNPSI